MPSAISDACSPSPLGTASRIRLPNRPSRRWSLGRTALDGRVGASAASWIEVLRSSLGPRQHVGRRRVGGRRAAEMTIAPSIRLAVGAVLDERARSRGAVAAAVGRDEDERLASGASRRSSRRARAASPVAAALDAAPGPSGGVAVGEQQDRRSDSPGRVRITLRSSRRRPRSSSRTPARTTSPPWIAANRSATKSAAAASPSDPGLALGRQLGDRARGPRRGAGLEDAGRGRRLERLGLALDREHHDDERDDGGQEAEAVDARVDHRRKTPQVSLSLTSRCLLFPMAEPSARILLVDDEQAIQTLLTYPAAQGGLRGRPGARRPRGARALRGAASTWSSST